MKEIEKSSKKMVKELEKGIGQLEKAIKKLIKILSPKVEKILSIKGVGLKTIAVYWPKPMPLPLLKTRDNW